MHYSQKLREALRHARKLAKGGDIFGALALVVLTAISSKVPIRVSLRSRMLVIRPCTPDLDVAVASFSGEFAPAIEAATPLKNNFIIDAGGYIGTAAMVFAEAFPDAQILTLEPSLENFRSLRKNIEKYPNITAINKALGPNPGTTTLQDRGTGEWGGSIVAKPADCVSPTAKHDVEITTIHALMAEFRASGIDILKLDIEGGEHSLLEGAPSWVNLTHVIFAELHDRIAPGSTDIFNRATDGRSTPSIHGEKVLSIRN